MSEEHAEFQCEAIEILDMAENLLLLMERGDNYEDSSNSLFRIFHNLKGTAAMLGLPCIEKQMHLLEEKLKIHKTLGKISPDETSAYLEQISIVKNNILGAPSISKTLDIPQQLVPPKVTDLSLKEILQAPLPILQKKQSDYPISPPLLKSFDWSDEYSTQNATIDLLHRHLLIQIKELLFLATIKGESQYFKFNLHQFLGVLKVHFEVEQVIASKSIKTPCSTKCLTQIDHLYWTFYNQISRYECDLTSGQMTHSFTIMTFLAKNFTKYLTQETKLMRECNCDEKKTIEKRSK